MSRIVVVGLEECHDLIYGFISSIQNICVGCRNFDKVIGSSVLDILFNLLHLEVNFLWYKGDRRRDIGNVLTVIVEDSVEHCTWVYIRGLRRRRWWQQ